MICLTIENKYIIIKERKNKMLGKEVFFIDMNSKDVKQGVVLSSLISQSGYVVHIIFTGTEKKNVESALIFNSKQEAEQRLPVVLKIKDDMEVKEKQVTDELDTLRELVIGKPEYKELADGIFKNQK